MGAGVVEVVAEDELEVNEASELTVVAEGVDISETADRPSASCLKATGGFECDLGRDELAVLFLLSSDVMLQESVRPLGCCCC